jgi:ribose transport system permease protein
MQGGGSVLTHLRYRYFPDHLIGEILTKRWIDNAIPFLVLLVAIVVFGILLPGFLTINGLSDLGRQFAEFGLIVLGLTIVMISGGIDLSVASVYTLAVLLSLICVNVEGWPVGLSFLAVMALGVVCGSINGYLIGYLRLRAFLTTLVTLIIFRSICDIVFLRTSTAIISSISNSDLWTFIGEGTVLGVHFTLVVTAVIAIAWHIVLSRTRPGWRLTAVGGARSPAYNAGIRVRRTVCAAYIWSSVLSALAGFLFVARIGSTGADTGVGLEVSALTAAVLGGNSLGGGRGSVAKAVMGALLVLIVTDSLTSFGVSGPVNSTVLGCVLIAAVFVDMRFLRNRDRWLSKVYVSPAYLSLPAPPSALEPTSPYALNDKLRSVEVIGLGQIEGPEDVILDREDNLYCGTRHGDIVRFFGPDHLRHEVFAHIGGHPLGMAFDRKGDLLVCIGGMGLYAVSPDKTVTKLTDETNRSWLSVVDDSRLRLADDVDVAPDGRVYFSEATVRYEQEDWATDALESRGNGRIVANGAEGRTTADWKRDLMERGATGSLWLIDLSTSGMTAKRLGENLAFPTGLAQAPAGRLHVSEAWMHRILAFETAAMSAPRPLLSDLPAYSGRIAPAPHGGFWLALFAPRNQLVEFVLREDGYRRRMIDTVDPQFWIAPALSSGASFLEPIQGGARKKLNMLKPWSPSWSYGLVARCSPTMRPLQSFHSRADGAIHGVTSCCEFDGKLYVAAKGSGRIVAIDLADVGAHDR